MSNHFAGETERMPKYRSPMPLTAFEEYMFRDDRPAHPMDIVVRLRFSGALDRSAASVAWRQTIARHALLRSTILATGNRRPCWVAGEMLPPLCWTSDLAHGGIPDMGQPIDLATEPGLRGWAATDDRRSSITLQAHHAACDGKALVQVADDFLRSYARAIEGERCCAELTPCDEALLERRGTYGLTAGKLLKILPAQLTGLIGAGQFLFRQPVPLLANGQRTDLAPRDGPHPHFAHRARVQCAEGPDIAQPDEKRLAERNEYLVPAFRTGRVEADVLQRLSVAAAKQQVTVNDWLIRDFFRTVDEFRRRHETPRDKDWIRVSVPMNLRQPADVRLPAANVVSLAFLDRISRQIADPARLLRGIHEQMDLIRRRQLGLTFIWSLHALRALPGGLAGRFEQSGRCEATCVLSNLGRVMAASPLPTRQHKIVAGNLLLEGFDFFVPVRDGTAASVGLVFYGGELQVCLRYDKCRLTAGQADDLLTTYLRTIRASLGEPGAGTVDRPAWDSRKKELAWNASLNC